MGHGSLILIVKEGKNERQSFLTAYSIDFNRLTSEKVA